MILNYDDRGVIVVWKNTNSVFIRKADFGLSSSPYASVSISMYGVYCKKLSNVFSPKGLGFSFVGKTPGYGVDVDLRVFLKHLREKIVKTTMSNNECGPNHF